MPPKAAPKPTAKPAPAAKAPAAKPSAPAAKPAAKAATPAKTAAATPAPKAAPKPAAKAAAPVQAGTGSGVYIKGLANESVDDVKRLVAACGNVADVRLRRNKFALVWFDTAAAAKKAIESFNGKAVNGKQLSVLPSRAAAPVDKRSGAVTVFVSPIFGQMTNRAQVRDLFKASGKVTKLRIFRKNFAFVRFENAAGVQNAIKNVNGKTFLNKTLVVKPSVRK